MNKHIAQVHENKKDYVQCTICNKHFTSKTYLKEHIATVHEGKKPFQCANCDSRFTKQSKLKIHNASFHDGPKPFHVTKLRLWHFNQN